MRWINWQWLCERCRHLPIEDVGLPFGKGKLFDIIAHSQYEERLEYQDKPRLESYNLRILKAIKQSGGCSKCVEIVERNSGRT